MARCSTPDTLIGVGEGGSRIVYKFMQQRWILDEVLEDKTEDNGEIADNLQAVTIDSAVDDGFHNDKSSKVEDMIDEAIEDSIHRPRDGYLDFHGPFIVPDMISREWKGPNLTSGKIKDLAEDNGMTSWWMKEGREPLKSINVKGFDGGVHRLRSVSKALFHITEHTDVDITPNVGEEVCLVAALGGGTGSGMVLDLATKLSKKEGAQVNLFAIIPHDESGANEKTNAHAALSEIEYAEITGESPFESVTLIPHTKEVEHQNDEFEMAAVRTILAQQQMSGKDHYLELLPREEDQGAAPGFAPFQVAVPHTVQFDLKKIDRADDAVEDFLYKKRKELDKEADLYRVVEKYLSESFEGTEPGQIIDGRTKGTMEYLDGEGLEEAGRLRKRLETELIDNLLSQQALKIAGQEGLLKTLRDEFDEILDEDNFGYSEDAGTLQRAVEFIDKAPDLLLNKLESSPNFDKTSSDGTPYELIEAIKQELKNIKKRRDIWKAVTAIDEDLDGISEKDGKLIRRALLDVTIDYERANLSTKIVDPTLEERVKELRDEVENLRESESEVQEFWDTVNVNLRESRGEWYDDSDDPANTLANINENQDIVVDAINDLKSTIKDRVEAVSRAEQEAEVNQMQFDLHRMGPFGSDKDEKVNGISELNSMLKNMGVDAIPTEDIEKRFADLQEAKVLQIEHGDGILGTDNSEEFPPKAVDAQEDGWFHVNRNADVLDVTDEFRAEFNGDKLDRQEDIQDKRDATIETIVENFEEAFSRSDSLYTYESDDIDVPKSIFIDDVKKELEDSLDESTETTAKKVRDSVLPSGVIDSEGGPEENDDLSDVSPPMELIYKGYLQPISDHYEQNIMGRLKKLGAKGDKKGIINRLEKVRGLAEGPSVATVSPPEKYSGDPEDEETYGNQFVEKYEGLYEIEIDDDIESQATENPYLTEEDTKEDQALNEPDHIGQTDIGDDTRIEKDFRAAAEDLFEFGGKAPFNNLSLMGDASDDMGAEYPHLRVRQAYLSRAYHTEMAFGDEYEAVYEQFADHVSRVRQEDDVYKASRFGHGWEDDFTMVSFIGGIFLDNLSVVTQRNGYRQQHSSAHDENEFIGSHHSIGMGGNWEQWKTMGDWAAGIDGGEVGTYGAYVFRDVLRDPDEEFIGEILSAMGSEDESAKEIFKDMIETETYESTIDLS